MYAGHARQECSPFHYARISLIVFVCTCSKCTNICNELPPTHPFVNIVSIDATHSNSEFCCPTSCTHITNTIHVKIQRDVNFVNFMNDCRFAKINTRNIWRKDTENGEQETFFWDCHRVSVIPVSSFVFVLQNVSYAKSHQTCFYTW